MAARIGEQNCHYKSESKLSYCILINREHLPPYSPRLIRIYGLIVGANNGLVIPIILVNFFS